MITIRSARRGARIALFAAGLTAAIWLAWATTRRSPSSATPHEDHATMAAPTDSARPVSLSAGEQHRIGVTYAAVTTEPVVREVRVVGEVTADETRVSAISLKVEGWIERLLVDYTGRQVRKGEPLFTLYSPMLVSAQEELLLARRLGAQLGDSSGGARGGSERLVEAARRRLSYWGVPQETIAGIEQSDTIQRTVTFHSPTSGHVLEKNVVAGQQVMAGQTLYRITDLSRVWVEGEVFEQDLPLLRLGEPTTLEFRALPGSERTGPIVYLYPTLDPVTRTARVRVELANPRLDLKPGMYATLRFTTAGRADVASVPRSAVLVTGERSLVFKRLADGRLEPHEVQLGIASDDRIQVLRGIGVGDTIVASGTFLLDAESNLGTAMGGMGSMPGMDMAPPVPLDRAAGRSTDSVRTRTTPTTPHREH